MKLEDRIKNHLPTFFLTTVVLSFGAGWAAHIAVLKEGNNDVVSKDTYFKHSEAILKSEHEKVVAEIKQDRDYHWVRIADMPDRFRGDPKNCLAEIQKLNNGGFVSRNIHYSFAVLANARAQTKIIDLNVEPVTAEDHQFSRHAFNLLRVLMSPDSSKTYSYAERIECARAFQRRCRLNKVDAQIGGETWPAICYAYSAMLLQPDGKWEESVRQNLWKWQKGQQTPRHVR